MRRKTRMTVTSVVAVAAIGVGSGIAVANVGDDQPLTGTDLDQATQAALEHTGGGEVIESEVGDDGAAYGVEIRLGAGRVVEVNLDDEFNVIGSENDDPNDTEEAID